MEQAHTAAPPLRYYVVEDSPMILERVLAMLEPTGAQEAGHAAGVQAAIDGILAERPDVVILDMQLADGTGFDVLRAVRARAPEIDVYFLSNFAADPYRQLAARLGARGFFDKSNEFNRIRDVVVERAAARADRTN